MGLPATQTRGLVLKKTRLKESDLIVAILAEDGSLIRAVANGARKPKSALAATLELFSVDDLLVRPGRNLSTIVEAKSVSSHGELRASVEASFAAATNVDLAGRIAQERLPLARIFDATTAGLARLAALAGPTLAEARTPNDDERAQMLGVSSALLLKDLAYVGLRPSFSTCVLCGETVALTEGGVFGFNALEGGLVCSAHRGISSKRIPGQELLWARYLLHEPFAAILANHPGLKDGLAILRLTQDFIAAHTGYPLRSVDVLLKSRLFAPESRT